MTYSETLSTYNYEVKQSKFIAHFTPYNLYEETLRKLKQHGVTQDRILFVSIVCAPEGIEAIKSEFPDIRIITVAIDSHLNAQKFIVPGLGDFGDRYFGTE